MGAEGSSPFGRELRARRREAGLSQEALAARAGLSADAVAALERGRRLRPRAHTLRALADGLALPPPARRRFVAAAEGGGATVGVLPVLSRPIIGRERERTELVDLLGGVPRVVTLTGPAGVGKTRLALSVAHALAEAWDGDVWWAWLGQVTDPAALRGTVGAALAIRDSPGSGLAESLRDRLKGRPGVLVLDNCEHLLGPVAGLCGELIGAAACLRVLATSREPLRLTEEVAYEVSPLAVPGEAPGSGLVPATLRGWSATRLFLDRAGEVAHDLEVDEPTAAAITSVCRRLDGLPLAIELAAARMGTMPATRLAAQLSTTLEPGATGDPGRHGTMDAAIGWSYELLDPAEQTVFARLSVASGGWTLEAAKVFAAGGAVTADQVLDLVARLARKSLVTRRDHANLRRYAMLQVIRAHAASRLADSGEAAGVHDRHARCYSALAERAATQLRGPDQRLWLDRLEADEGNLRAALAHWHHVGDTDAALRTATALWRFCYLRGRYAEGRDWLDEALAAARERPPVDGSNVAAALVAAGTLAYLQCDYDLATTQVQAALSTYRSTDDLPGTANALHRLGSIARERGDYGRATALHTEALDLSRGIGEPIAVGEALNYLAFVAWLTGDHRLSEALGIEALGCLRGQDTGEGTVWAQLHLGISARQRGARDEAEERLQEAMDRSEELGYVEGTAWCLDQLGELARTRGAPELAWDLQHEALTLHAQVGDRWRAASAMEGLAATAALGSRFGTAARLCAAGESLRSWIGTPRPPCERALFDHTLAAVRAGLEPRDLASATRDPHPERVLRSLAELHDVEAALVH